jgi:phosphoribosylformylglycinamidine synthase
VNNSLHNLGLTNVQNVRIGKHVTMHLEAHSKDEAEGMARDACKKLLANQVMESFDFTLTEG